MSLAVSTPTNTVPINSVLTFTVNVTNESIFPFSIVQVTNSVSGQASVQLLGATTTTGSIVTNSSSIIFNVGPLGGLAAAQMTVTVQPTSAEAFTNGTSLTGLSFDLTVTNVDATNIVVQVTPPAADLAVSISPPVPPVLVDDWIHYAITITNAGTNAAANVIVTNTGFDTLTLLSLAPANTPYVLTNGLLILNAGTLAGQAAARFDIEAQPTISGNLTLSATVAATGAAEENLTNNTATAEFTVEDLFNGDLIATNSSAMVYNPQTGLMEQKVRLVNQGTNQFDSARVIVYGLTNLLYNAVGTNDGNPFVIYAATLAPGQGVDLLLEYFVPTRLPILVPDSSYAAMGTSLADQTAASTSPPNITKVVRLADGSLLIEFESLPGRSYTIFYSDTVDFSHASVAQPPITAPADRVQWIDSGPPKTISPPNNTASRYYRVQLNP